MTHGNFSNQLLATVKPREPQVGDGATLILWSDRQAFTILDVKNPASLSVGTVNRPHPKKRTCGKTGIITSVAICLKLAFGMSTVTHISE